MRQTAILSSEQKDAPGATPQHASHPGGVLHGSVPRWIAPALAALGIALMVIGIWRGEMLVVFRKAVAICLECIGIG